LWEFLSQFTNKGLEMKYIRLLKSEDLPGPDQRFDAALSTGTLTSLQGDVIRARSLRDLRRQMLGEMLYSGPAWDILLHLFEAHVLDRRETVGNVCDCVPIPASTAFRWMTALLQEDLVRLGDDPLDRNNRVVELSGLGADLMTKYFTAVAPHSLAA
jgi:hypothetical protein